MAECWLNDFKVHVYNFDKNDTSPEVQTLKKNVKRTSPTGKLIDIATNDLMKSSRACSCCCRTSIW